MIGKKDVCNSGDECDTVDEPGTRSIFFYLNSCLFRYCILRFQIRVVAFDRCKPFDSNSYHRILHDVQSQNSTVYAMTQWLPDPGGLADHLDFLLYMSLIGNTAGPWFKLSVFGELG